MIGELAHVARFIARHPLTSRHRTEAFLRFAGFQLKARLNEEVIVPWISGTRLAVRRGMRGATGNIYAGLQDFPEMAFVLHFLRPGDVFCDVGANVGSYTVLASGVCGARTLAFEPDPDSASALGRNVTLNDLMDLVTAYEVGLGAYEGEAHFTIGLGTENRITEGTSEQTRTIQVSTLDRTIGNDVPILLKIDVEGFNIKVIKGTTSLLASKDLKAIIIEWPSQVYDILTEFNFEMVTYDPFERRFERLANQNSQNNYLFVRDRKFVEDRVMQAQGFHIFGQWI